MENKEFQHPEGKIKLLDGRVLDCYPLEQPQEKVDNQLALDTTGQYFAMKKSKDHIEINVEDEEKAMETLFLENAFVFLENREKIMSDSRMFLCPVPSHSGLAYTGTGGFRNPTLGVFVEWWIDCLRASQMEPNGKKWLVYHLAGSPLSGANNCGLVNPQGETKSEYISSFRELWPSFMQINRRYDDAKSRYEAYTLREVLAIFEREGCKVAFRKSTHIFFLEQANRQLKREIQNLKAYSNQLYGKYRTHILNEKRSELEAFSSEYQTKQNDVRNKLAMIQVQRMELRKSMREGVIDNLQYQRLWMPIHKEKNDIQAELVRFERDTLKEIIPEFCVSAVEVERFLKGEDNG